MAIDDPKNVECSIPCNLCGGSDVEVLSTRGRGGDPLRTVICTACGLTWSDPRPIEARSYYEQDYRRDYKGTVEPKPVHIYRAGRNALDRWAMVEEFAPKGARVLDVGSGGGEFLYLLKLRGVNPTGIEPNRGYGEFAKREYEVDVRVSFPDEIAPGELSAGEFAVVTMWHALEHAADPMAEFLRVREWLRPGGAFVVEVPSVEATCHHPGRRFHRAHLYNFNEATLGRMGEVAGFTLERMRRSRDGANLTATFILPAAAGRPAGDTVANAPTKPKAAIPGNCARIKHTLRRHTLLRHYLTHYPYTRPFGRLTSALEERIGARGISARHNLETLFD